MTSYSTLRRFLCTAALGIAVGFTVAPANAVTVTVNVGAFTFSPEGGFILGPADALNANVLIRAIGPSLSGSVSNALGDPVLDLRDGNGLRVQLNDNWKDTDEAAIRATTIPPTNDKESAIVANLPPGSHDAIVSGTNNTTGVALVKIYRLTEPAATHAEKAS